ncbi:metallophosphoesterase [Radiobacillus kanasensis]|uniref:metallophosphoesterase n=1 Tax=Radiobacillus kanasensis TaxID=2844358 RepID=UPI001E606ED1|nr:metallophosphoesterase [Radiobacillus kanasensis]UFU00869.1 metallophosphoesterase [Radiobacillus kanasensis]
MNRRTFLKRFLSSTLALLGLGGGTYYYAHEIEPKMLKIHSEKLMSPKIPNSYNGFKIIQFSDTHVGFHFSLEQLNQLVQQINKLEPDLVVFTGDLVDKPHTYEWNQTIINTLQGISSKQGKYWIYGNHDHGGYGTEIVKETMEAAGFITLQNNHTLITNEHGDQIALSGLDDMMLGKPNIEQTVQGIDESLYSVLLVHEPDFADISKDYPVDVQLSGHSHGGQIQIPLIGYLYTPAYAEKYVEGKYTFEERPMELFVSRGIGTTRVPYRFLCKPEITVFTLNRKSS